MPFINVEIDASDLIAKVERLRANMTQAQFERAMYGIFQRTGKHVKRILQQDLPQKYEIKPGEVGSTVGAASLSMGGGGVGCIIPVRGPRRNIGTQFKASGGAHGWNNVKYGRKYRVKAKVVKGAQSVLPPQWHTGFPPFRNLGSSLGNLTFARSSKARGPIMKVFGIAIPQMPMNLAEPEVQNDIKVYLEKQMDDRFRALMLGH